MKYNINFNATHFIKYIIQFICVSTASYLLSPCSIKKTFAIFIGILSASIFAVLDYMYPKIK